MTHNTTFSRALALLIILSSSVFSYAQETTFTNVEFTGVFGGTVYDGSFYTAPTGAEPWGGFANEDVSLYPLSFVDGGLITFTGATSGTDAEVYFRFEYNPYPDTEPSFSTLPLTVSGVDASSYSVVIPSQGTNTFSSFLLYVTTTDAPVSLTDVSVTASFSSSDVYGCMDPTATNYDSSATIDDASCEFPFATVEFVVDMNGVDQPSAEYAQVTVNGSWNGWNGFGAELFDADGDGVYTGSLEIAPGTTFEYVVAVSGEADGYSGWGLQWGDGCVGANVIVTAGDAGTVTTSTLTPGCAELLGCLDANASNYDATATAQAYDQYGNLGCIYASCDDVPEYGCIYVDGFGAFNAEFDAALCVSYGGTPCEDSTTDVAGCTDATATNYDAAATIDDGSCSYTVLTITTTVCDAATSVAMTGPWWGWDPAAGPVASDNGDGSWTFTFDPAPADNMEYLLVVDGVQENLVAAGTASADWSCTPVTDYFSYANRQWVVGSGDVSNTYGTCGACEVESTTATIEFIVDMNGVDQPSAEYDNVVVNGSWNGWQGWGVTLADADADGVYTGSLEIEQGTTFEYVVAVTGPADGYSGWGMQWGDGCGNANVIVTAGDAGTVTTSTLTPGCAEVLGCLDANASNYDATATAQAYDQYGNLSCIYASCDDVPEYGCIYADGFGAFNAEFGADLCTTYGGTPCEEPAVLGCMYANADNYNALAVDDDGSCVFPNTSTCLGDLDGDNTAGTSDLLALLSSFGTVCD